MEKTSPKFKRVTVYLNDQEYRELRSILVLEGLTISEWFRRTISKELEED